MFSNEQIVIEDLPKVDDLDLKPISRKYLNIIVINRLTVYTILLTLLFVARMVIDDVQIHQYFWYLVGALSIVIVLNFIISILAFFRRKYSIREHDIVYAKGIIVQSLIAVPLLRIQHVEESRTWLARQFGLTTIKLYTAGESGTDLRIQGIPQLEAKQINDFISSKINGRD